MREQVGFSVTLDVLSGRGNRGFAWFCSGCFLAALVMPASESAVFMSVSQGTVAYLAVISLAKRSHFIAWLAGPLSGSGPLLAVAELPGHRALVRPVPSEESGGPAARALRRGFQ